MAITGIDSCISGASENMFFYKTYTGEVSNNHHSSWIMPGIPGEAPSSTAGLAGEVLASNTGGTLPYYTIPFIEEVGKTTYLGNLTHCSSITSSMNHSIVTLCDRLWQNSDIVVTTTTAQTINSITWPARDNNGTSNGEGVIIGMEIHTATTNAGTINGAFITYTNSDNVSGRTGYFRGNASRRLNSTMVRGYFCPIVLSQGDRGVKSIQSITLTTSLVSGSINLVAFRVIDIFNGLLAHHANNRPTSSIVSGPRPILYSGTVPFLIVTPEAANSTSVLNGQLHYILA
jgi:hypothetical protein